MPIRPRRDKKILSALIEEHGGNLTQIAKVVTDMEGKRVTRQVLSLRLDKLQLLPLAATEREKNAISGRRPTAKAPSFAKARAAFIEALAAAESDEAAREAMGMKRRTFYRRKRDLEITREEVERARQARRPR